MKRLNFYLLAGILFSGIFSLTTQAQNWDSTFRPASYAIKVDNFSAYPRSSKDIVFLGNSITFGGEWHELFLGEKVINRGISGDISFGVIDRLADVVKGNPYKVFVLVGINDIARNIPSHVILNNYERIIRTIKAQSPKTQIVFQSLFPVNNSFPKKDHFNKDETIISLNQSLKSLCAKEKIQFIDLYTPFLDTEKKLDKQYTYDGLHLNAAGYKKWASIIKPYLKEVELPVFNIEGHRGAKSLYPENTIGGMYKAIDVGANSIEIDVIFSKDKKVVVSHDLYFHDDFSVTPEGDTLSKEEGEKRLLYNMNYDSIRKYDVGINGHKRLPHQPKAAAYKPLMGELMDSVENYLRRNNKTVIYNIELKTGAFNDGVRQPLREVLIDSVVKIVKEKGLEKRAYLQSFDFETMRIVHRKYPELTTAILLGGADKRTLEEQFLQLGYVPEIYSPHYSAVNNQMVTFCKENGIKLVPWTVNTKEEIKKLIALGVDGIITDYPQYFKEL